MTPQELRELSQRYGWIEIKNVKDPHLVSFGRDDDSGPQRVNVWPITMTVGVYVTTKDDSKRQIFRRYVNDKKMESIFKNPIWEKQ